MPGPWFLISGKIWLPKQIYTNFGGRTCIVTGSNAGVDYTTALKYADLDASTVIFAVRSMQKGQKTEERIDAVTGGKAWSRFGSST